MSYRIPTFNLTVNVWRAGTAVTDPPDLTTLGCMSIGRSTTMTTGIPEDPSVDTVTIRLFVPKLTDVRDAVSPPGADTLEVPAGTGRYYIVRQVDDVGKGFPNEFRFAAIAKLAPWPAPIP
jgi:hypothetical protein